MNGRVAPHVQTKLRTMLSSIPLVLALPTRSLVASFTDGCRQAALDFVNRVAVTNDKEALAEWLRGPYRTHVVTLARSRTYRVGAASVVPSALEKLLAQARLEVSMNLLRTRDPEDGVGFGYSALAAGLVYRAQDATGAMGWVPVAQPRMRLTDRVLSLVAADYLLRSADYETQLYTCATCGITGFDAEGAKLGLCDAHANAHPHRALAHSDIRELGSGACLEDTPEEMEGSLARVG
jgi:hypothetical protein